ncbi:hypothetical protein EV641_10140 [Rhodococcus sp. SMB37]|uniref:hypothetical protein n=1 Tax=Rhodococcus sp. SMB37 TaxID=2512213 RepID=UPI0006D14E86|nr:hypothetical protein [Rhodococcus sp. SMB37]TCN57945.1 hypothetical protein EV641_10140 [Rhodococcus sp. SMB37]
MSSPSLTVAVWTGSWLSGHAAADDVIDALLEWAPMHLVAAHDEDAAAPAGLRGTRPVDGAAGLLTAIRRADPAGSAGIRLVLPAAGDVHGLPVGTEFAAAALAAGEGVLVGAPGTQGLGLVPTVEGPDVLHWKVFALPMLPEPPTPPGLGEAEFTMKEAVRDAAATLTRIQTVDTNGRHADPRAAIAEQVAEYARHRYPEVLPPRAVRILESADQVAAILTVASAGKGRQAGSASAAAAREDALRPLWSAVRLARIGAVAATLGALDRHR